MIRLPTKEESPPFGRSAPEQAYVLSLPSVVRERSYVNRVSTMSEASSR